MNTTAIILGIAAIAFGYYSITNTAKLSTILLALLGITLGLVAILKGMVA